jgi:hypothetical protein
MVDFRVVGERRGEETVYWLEGVFDCRAAEELERAIAHQPSPLTLEFSRVSRVVDHGLASFAQKVLAGGRFTSRITLAGLGTHHRRLLHYFGIDVDSGSALTPDFGADALAPPEIVPPEPNAPRRLRTALALV